MGIQPRDLRRGDAWRTALGGSALFALAAVLLALWEFQTPEIRGYDGHYHIKYAWLWRTEGWIAEFPWAARSLWADGFADKEIGYHLLLIPFTWFKDAALGIKVASVIFGAAALASFWLVLRLDRVRFATFWFVVLIAAGPHFLLRVAAPRPQVLSILLMLWAIYAIVHTRRRLLAVLSFVYSLTYSGFHVVVILAVVAAGMLWLARGELDWQTPLAALSACLLGVLVNPYFPDNVQLYWVQNWVVPWLQLFGDVDLLQGPELTAFRTRELLVSLGAVTLSWTAAVTTALVRPARSSTRTLQLFGVSLTLVAMTLLSRRFTEYSVPITLWFCASFFAERLPRSFLHPASNSPVGRLKPIAGAGAVGIALLALLSWAVVETTHSFRDDTKDLRGAAEYLQGHTARDELVFTCDWDDAPRLFRYNHHNRYLVFLDPAFMYFWDSDYWHRWTALADGRLAGRTYSMLAEEFEYGVCTQNYEDLRVIVERDPRMTIVFEDEASWVFRIDREQSGIDLEDFLELGDEATEPPR